MDDQQIQELFSDKEFVDSLLGRETPEAVQETLAEKGLDLTLDEIITIKTSLENDQIGELSEKDLLCVAGGSSRIFTQLIVGIVRIIAQTPKITRW